MSKDILLFYLIAPFSKKVPPRTYIQEEFLISKLFKGGVRIKDIEKLDPIIPFKLRNVDLSGININSAFVSLLFKWYPMMISLNLSGCKQVDINEFNHIASKSKEPFPLQVKNH